MPNRRVFLDTNGWLALLNSTDQLHARANALWRNLGRQNYSVLLTDWIIAETGNGLARTQARERFVMTANAILHDGRCRVVFVNPEIIGRAFALYRQRTDKQWGLVDCVSFLVMADEQVVEAFTTDRHFEQAGLKTLLL